jgi:hypothetical protein
VRSRQALERGSEARRTQIGINHGLDFESIPPGQRGRNDGIE